MLSSSETAPFGTGLAPSATALGRLRKRALNLLVRHAVFGDSHRAAQALRRDLGLPPLAGSFLDWGAVVADRYLHTTIPEFEYPRGNLPGTLEFVGTPPLGGVDDWSRPAWWADLAAARDRGRPVVVLTQGTVATEPSNLLLPAIEALGRSDVLVVATTGGPDPESVLPERRRPANLRLETFVPFAQLLPLADLVVTNGGYGGVQSALAHGVPLVTAGRSEDKMEVNARVAWSGAGISLKTDRPTPRQIADAVSAVLGTSAYRDRAQALRDAYSRYDAPRRAADLILAAASKRGLQQAKPTGRTGRGSGLHFTPARRHAICR
jgi:UDP:flavonoid glycosyltransferase YjiC (YdhE family)